MRGWTVTLLGGAAALLGALWLHGGDDDVAGAGAAAPALVDGVAAATSSPPPPPPRLPAGEPAPAAGGVDIDALIERHEGESEAELDGQLAAIDAEIASRQLIEHANAGALSSDDEAALRGLLQRRNAVNIVKARRLIARLEALEPASRAAGATP